MKTSQNYLTKLEYPCFFALQYVLSFLSGPLKKLINWLPVHEASSTMYPIHTPKPLQPVSFEALPDASVLCMLLSWENHLNILLLNRDISTSACDIISINHLKKNCLAQISHECIKPSSTMNPICTLSFYSESQCNCPTHTCSPALWWMNFPLWDHISQNAQSTHPLYPYLLSTPLIHPYLSPLTPDTISYCEKPIWIPHFSMYHQT